MKETRENVRARYPGAETYTFGDNATLSSDLLTLVRSGRKRAICTALVDVGVHETLPAIGRRDIVLDWEGEPALVTRTMELRLVRYCDMTEDLALMEGEDESLESWSRGHCRYYERQGIFDPEMELVWERFEIVEDFAEAGGCV